MAAEQVWMASLHMDGIAAEWYYALEREYGLLSWARFTEFVNLRFGPPIRLNPLGELKELHRTSTVEEYQRQFLTLLCHCEGLSPQHQMNLFIAGLGEPMSSDVEMQRPADLQAAMSLTQAFERRAGAASAVSSLTGGRSTSRTRPSSTARHQPHRRRRPTRSAPGSDAFLQMRWPTNEEKESAIFVLKFFPLTINVL
jgi:hypothetical protein